MLTTWTCWGTISWSRGNLPGAILWKKTDSPFPNSHQLSIAPQLGLVGSCELLSIPCWNSFAWMNNSNTVSMLTFNIEVFSSLGLQRSRIAIEYGLFFFKKCETCLKYLHAFYIPTCDVPTSWCFVRSHLIKNNPGIERWLSSQEEILPL